VGKRHQTQRQHQAVDVTKLEAIIERAKAALSMEEHATLKASLETLAFLQQELKSKGASIERLRQIVFGSKTEKTSAVFPNSAGPGTTAGQPKHGEGEGRAKKPGHGRNGAAAYTGAAKVKVAHPSLTAGQPCADCLKGKLYPMAEPAVLVRVTGMAPLSATVYERERLRCNLCGEISTAPAPEGVGDAKYDETATSMTALLKYGAGLPFNRIEKLQAGMGIPLPAATQWELVRDGVELLAPAHEELIREAAQGDVLYNDDTTMKVLGLTAEQRAAAAADVEPDGRTGVFTSGIVSTREGRKVALFFTGAQHAGENLSDVLARRAAELPTPIQMCDALSRNTNGDFATLVANCMAHSRRRYVEVADAFPEECRHVLETLAAVYKFDAEARDRKLSPEERLRFHQAKSGPLMEGLDRWMRQQFDERKVEPNSGLGEAITYMRKHWLKLTLFLQQPGAPLDNNICERSLKKAILHRKNSLFYLTENGARVGDIFMSLIHTVELGGGLPFEYLAALLRHHEAVALAPADWMPWNYAATLAQPRRSADQKR
jgi:transposase